MNAPLLKSALEALNADSVTLCKELLKEAIEQIEGYQEECHRAHLLIPTLPEDNARELCAILVGE